MFGLAIERPRPNPSSVAPTNFRFRARAGDPVVVTAKVTEFPVEVADQLANAGGVLKQLLSDKLNASLRVIG